MSQPAHSAGRERGGRLLLVGLGVMGRPYVDRAHRRGLRVCVVDTPAALADAEVQALLRPGDSTHAVRGRGDSDWYAAASAALDDGVPAGVVAFADPHVVAAALIADELGLPGPGLRAATTSRDKSLQRLLFARHGLSQPAFHVAHDLGSALSWAGERYPVVAKPLAGSASWGVRVVARREELCRWYEELGSPPAFLVEQHLASPECSAEALVVDGELCYLNLTDKVTTPPPYCVELEHHVPATLAGREREGMQRLTRAAVEALGVASGIVHLEARLEPGCPHVLEVAVRTPGDYIMELVELATGVDLFDAVVAAATGERPDLRPRPRASACVWYPAPRPGRVLGVEGMEVLLARPGVLKARIRAQAGGSVAPFRSSSDRVGWVLLEAPEPEELARRLDSAKRCLRIVTEPLPPGGQ